MQVSSLTPDVGQQFASQATPQTDELQELCRAFGADFALVDGESGELIHVPEKLPGGDWLLWGAVCRQLALGPDAALIDEREPIGVLGVPIRGGDDARHVAVGVFLIAPITTEDQQRQVAAILDTSHSAAAEWAKNQTPWTATAMLRLATVVQEKIAARRQSLTLQGHVEQLSNNLASTYEEISLLFRLTENLRLSEDMRTLGQSALEWLSEVIPARGLAAEFSAATRLDTVPGETEPAYDFLRCGEFPADQSEFRELVARLNVGKGRQPVVVNAEGTDRRSWPGDEIRNLVIVPLATGEMQFGYLAAVNHLANREFGTVEARLLGSVATILAIHCGNIVLFREQAELLSGIVRALTSAIDAKDPYTCGHSDRVGRVAVRLAEEMQLAPEMKNTLYLAGLLHDVGKIGIDDDVLRKPGKLTPAEYEHIKTHPMLGYKILRDLKKIEHVLPAVLHHHESWDGRGYPDGLKAERIPLIARIIAVADAFDAMGSDRPYRKGMDDLRLDQVLRAGAGQQWDAQVVEAFFRARDDIREIARREREQLQLDSRSWTKATADNGSLSAVP